MKALKKFNDAIKISGFNSELYYNIALCHFERQAYVESMQHIDTIVS